MPEAALRGCFNGDKSENPLQLLAAHHAPGASDEGGIGLFSGFVNYK